MATNCVDNLDVYILTVDNLGVYQRTLLDQANWSNLEKNKFCPTMTAAKSMIMSGFGRRKISQGPSSSSSFLCLLSLLHSFELPNREGKVFLIQYSRNL
jgi:hypothetical protein